MVEAGWTNHGASVSGKRIAHFTWANFTCTQSTGGIAILLSETPHQFHGLQTLGVVVFILKLVLFVLFCSTMLARFVLHPPMFPRSLTKPPEPFFFGSFLLSVAVSIISIQRFGQPHTGYWLVVVIRILFWMYAAISLLLGSTLLVLLMANASVDPLQLSPAVFLTVFNIMLTGNVASAIAQSQPPDQRLPIIVAGISYQGLGWTASLAYMPLYIGSLFANGLPPRAQRPVLFMPVGSAGFTIVSLIGCARYIPAGVGYFAQHPSAPEVLQIVVDWASIFLWLFGFWLFAIGLLANLPLLVPYENGHFKPKTSFSLAWWGIIFPNVGFTMGTEYIGQQLQLNATQWVATIMTVLLFAFSVATLVFHIKPVATRQIMWPGKDEDVTLL
ncbi:amidohydrolase [Apiospora phragmitis]|uniref:Amidohydrolase n=1 Tax=Apiospora phragmitis TaxID=2905665 RepID=A0ABR1T311_9PEZI